MIILAADLDVAGLKLGLLPLIFCGVGVRKMMGYPCIPWGVEKGYDTKAVIDGITFLLMPLQNKLTQDQAYFNLAPHFPDNEFLKCFNYFF